MLLLENSSRSGAASARPHASVIAWQLRHPARACRYTVELASTMRASSVRRQARRRLLIFGVRKDSGERATAGTWARSLATVRGASPTAARCLSPGHIRSKRCVIRNDDRATSQPSRPLSDTASASCRQGDEPQEYASAFQSAFQRMGANRRSGKMTDTRTPEVRAKTIDRLLHIPPGGVARANNPKST
jgi:hypothetical protein